MKLVSEYDIYEQDELFCPFCTNSNVRIHFIYYYKDTMKLYFQCCYLHLTVFFSNEKKEEYGHAIDMNWLSNNSYQFDFNEFINPEIEEMKNRIKTLYNTFHEIGYKHFYNSYYKTNKGGE